ncbi:importin beta-like SAD2 [Iris pallida]|uniref:Importin beta-like SAD2 n=1 Tax=Iris pallida TaxID=29817 RepID=A0AAX6H6T5_IRIPA|nr:importin beta-like SAD2 [Iris pallida]
MTIYSMDHPVFFMLEWLFLYEILYGCLCISMIFYVLCNQYVISTINFLLYLFCFLCLNIVFSYEEVFQWEAKLL